MLLRRYLAPIRSTPLVLDIYWHGVRVLTLRMSLSLRPVLTLGIRPYVSATVYLIPTWLMSLCSPYELSSTETVYMVGCERQYRGVQLGLALSTRAGTKSYPHTKS